MKSQAERDAQTVTIVAAVVVFGVTAVGLVFVLGALIGVLAPVMQAWQYDIAWVTSIVIGLTAAALIARRLRR